MTEEDKRKRSMVFMETLWSLALVLGFLVCGCSDAEEDRAPPMGASKVFYMKRDLTTGFFQPYVLGAPKAIDRLRMAIHDDVNASKQPGDFGVSLSVNHVLLFYESENTMVFKCQLLGDEYLIVDEERYYGKATLKCLQNLMQTEFKPATSEAMKGLIDIEMGNRGVPTENPIQPR